jgi:predicted house-cleaning NTP pyrophosphatase (Maf/HAM1 superfamily)
MKYKLIKKYNENELKKYDTTEIVLMNRGIPYQDIEHYLNTTDKDVNDAEMLGSTQLQAAASALIKAISNNDKAIVIIDCDADGFTSSAILFNYLHNIFPS